MKPVRLAKVSLVALIGLFALLVGYNNIADYGSNYEFVRHVLLMDTTFPGNALRGRAIESESLHRIAYALIIAVELICGVTCLAGAVKLAARINAPAADFDRARGFDRLLDRARSLVGLAQSRMQDGGNGPAGLLTDTLGCAGTTQRVFINSSDRTIGWEFNRPICGGAKAKPDYPEVEFGVAPFGSSSPLLTTPSCSTTLLLPKQIKDITIASVKVDTLQITLQKPTIWNINFEMWLSQRNPVTDANPGVVAEIIVFWGWENGRWACDKTGTVTAGSNTYQLCHQSDDWSTGHWKFYQFNVQGGPLQSYSGSVDVLALTNWVVNTYGLSKDLWVTRLEVGSEIDDNTQGTVRIKNLTFEINGQNRSIELAP
jgi:hypothetical protein